MKYITLVLSLLFFAVYTQVSPPVWPNTFSEAFYETFVDSGKSSPSVNGILYYDATNNRSRYDRQTGEFDKFCGSLAPNVTTLCTNLVANGKLYIIFPNKNQCCECCDSA